LAEVLEANGIEISENLKNFSLKKYFFQYFVNLMENIQRKIIHIDMDAFYASVEQQDNLEYQNKPLIFVPCITDYTCAIAASYQAKRLGVKTGTKVKVAKEKIPSLIVVEARPNRYVEVHNKILEILGKSFNKIQVLSIDEMACEISEDDDFDCEDIKNVPSPVNLYQSNIIDDDVEKCDI
jgi:hypothetical protein